MTSLFPDPPKLTMHPDEDVLAAYAASVVDEIAAWSLEAHLSGCAQCRGAVSAHVDAERLARNRSVLLVSAAIPAAGPVGRLLRRVGVPDHLLRLLAATPSLRRSWLLAVVAVMSAVSGESILLVHIWSRPFGDGVWVAFVLIAPLLVLAGVAAAFLPVLDPAYRLTAAAPFSGFRLLLLRTLSALVAALVPVVVAAFVVPGPRWLPAALLLPSLALCALALAAGTVVGPQAAAIAAAALWVFPVVLLAATNPALVVVQWHGQTVCAAVLAAAITVVWLRRDRFELGWTR